MQVQAIRSFLAACVLASALHAVPADETVLFANYSPQDQPKPASGGWRIGAIRLDQDRAGKRALGMLITPSSTGYVSRIEAVLHRESGGHSLIGYLMTDASGPGSVLAKVSFSVPDSLQPQVVSAVVDERPFVRESQPYWFVLESANPAVDSIFWYRREGQPSTSIAFQTNDPGGLRVQPGTHGAMLRLYGEASTSSEAGAAPVDAKPAQETNQTAIAAPFAPSIAPPSPAGALPFPDSLTNQKLILLHVGNDEQVRIKKSHLATLKGSCDIAVQVRQANWSRGKLSLRLDHIGAPIPDQCYRTFDTLALEISGFDKDESMESIEASVRQLLQTPDEYLASKGIIFNQPPGPEDEYAVNLGGQVTPAKPLLQITGEFSEEARRAKFQGTVLIAVVIGTDGRIHQPQIVRGGEMGLGENALKVLSMWRFEPARQAGKLVATRSHMEMNFHVY